MALRSRLAGAGFKPPQAARVKSPDGERCGKRRSRNVPGHEQHPENPKPTHLGNVVVEPEPLISIRD
jgi:hypothetical protein